MILQLIKNYFLSVIFDTDFLRGATGTTMAIVFPSIVSFTKIVQVAGASLGLLLVILSIYHKVLEIKKLKNDRNK